MRIQAERKRDGQETQRLLRHRSGRRVAWRAFQSRYSQTGVRKSPCLGACHL
jgi:hypothetical protein